jgi:hypothetical protein
MTVKGFENAWEREVTEKPLTPILLFGVFLFLAWARLLSAQTNTAQLDGRITDSSGGIIQGAQVVVINLDRGIQREVSSNEEGYYSCPFLPQGNYRITVVVESFKPTVRSGIRLGVQQAVRVDFILELGGMNQVVEVVDSLTSLNMENAQLSDVRPRDDLLNLPVNDRSTFRFFFLSSFNYQGQGSSFSLGGLRGVNTNFTLDGVTSNSALFGGQIGPMTETSLESVRELKVFSSNNSAEFPGVGTVMISSRSGENQLHGGAFFMTSNNALNARNPFSPDKPSGPSRHEFGGSLGGPVMIPGIYDGHRRTFYYFTWEQQRFQGTYAGTANVPTLKMRQGDFSELLPKTVVFDPLMGQPFPGNIIPVDRISPLAQKIQEFGFLLPNFGPPGEFSANWRGLLPDNEYNNRVVVRLDHQIRTSDAFSFRLNLRSIPLPGMNDADLPIFRHDQDRQERNAYISEIHVFSGQLLNEFRFGYSRDFSRQAGLHKGAELVEQFGLEGIDLSTRKDLTGVPGIRFVNFSEMTELPTYFWMTETHEFLDNVTYARGRHGWRLGAMIRHNRGNISTCCDSDFGTFSFDGFATGYDYADFLLGLPQSSSRFQRSQPRYDRYSELGIYLQDDLQLTSQLTLNLGVRYDYFSPPVDKYDMRYSFDPANGKLVITTPEVRQELVSPVFPQSIPLVTADEAGFPPRSLLESQRRNFGPRVGFAYRFLDRTVLRGGYGIYYTRLASTLLERFSGGPFQVSEVFQNEIDRGVARFQFPNPFTGGSLPAQSITPVSKNLATPYTQQWNLTLEHEFPSSILARATYRGFMTLNIPYIGDINKPSPSSNPEARDFFRYPYLSQVNFLQDGGIQKLEALDVAVERKFTRGLTFQSGWTWAKNLTDVGDDDETGSIENPFDRRREMGNISWTPRHRFVGQVLYELPFKAQKPAESSFPAALRQLLDNWQVSVVAVLQTGQFLTPAFSGSDPSNTRTEGGRPDQIGNPRLADPTISHWFDASAFALPPSGRFGNSARGVIVGPGLANLDFGLYKHFYVKEKGKLQLRVTATNVLNHPNWGNPNIDISSLNVGKITTLQGDRRDTLGGGPRAIQLGFRFDF